MQYNNLQSLINNSSSTRKYFLSLPVATQLELHKHNEYIHSATDLHKTAFLIEKQFGYIENSNSLDSYFKN